MRILKISVLSILGLMVLGGCGGEITNNLSENGDNLQPHKIDRSVLEYIKNDDGENANLSVFNDKDNYSFSLYPNYSTNTITENKQIFIDLDKSGQSGYTPDEKDGIGAEYLIENGSLFKYIGEGGFDFLWEYIEEVGNVHKSYLPINYFGENVNTFDVQAAVLDKDWEARFLSKVERFTKVINRKENEKYIDREKNFSMANDDLNYYFNWPSEAYHAFGVHNQFFVDSDLNAQTGYSNGADYLVEDKILFKYTGNGGYDWSWKEVQRISNIWLNSSFEIGGYIVVPKEAVSDWSSKIKVQAVAFDEDWNEMFSTVSGEY